MKTRISVETDGIIFASTASSLDYLWALLLSGLLGGLPPALPESTTTGNVHGDGGGATRGVLGVFFSLSHAHVWKPTTDQGALKVTGFKHGAS